MPPTEPLAVFHLAGEGAFLVYRLAQIAWALDAGRGFILFSANSEIWNRPRRRRRARPRCIVRRVQRVQRVQRGSASEFRFSASSHRLKDGIKREHAILLAGSHSLASDAD